MYTSCGTYRCQQVVHRRRCSDAINCHWDWFKMVWNGCNRRNILCNGSHPFDFIRWNNILLRISNCGWLRKCESADRRYGERLYTTSGTCCI